MIMVASKLVSFLHVTLRMVVSCISPSPEVLSAARQASNRPSSWSVMVMMMIMLTVIKRMTMITMMKTMMMITWMKMMEVNNSKCCALRM